MANRIITRTESGVKCNFCGFIAPVLPAFKPIFENCPRCRDQFAMAAPLQISGYDPILPRQSQIGWPERLKQNANARYEWADAMLEARKPK